MPKEPWNGYGRFCPLARALDVVGDRWTLVILQELLKRNGRFTELQRRLPGIGTGVLSNRLRRLEAAGVVERRPGAVSGVEYALTERGHGLDDVFVALRRWGVQFLVDSTADGSDAHEFDVTYVVDVDSLPAGVFQLVVDGDVSTLSYHDGHLVQTPGRTAKPELVVSTTAGFMDRWAAGDQTWDDGRDDGSVAVKGSAKAWRRFLTATGYLLRHEPDGATA